jgi:hypothetical protein
VGENDTGYDVKFFGATASAYMLWDESADDLILAGAARVVVPASGLVIASTAVSSTAAELNLLDGLDRGSILYGNASSATTVLGQGSADQVLTSDGTDISWADAAGGVSLSGSTNNTVATVTGANALIGEANLTFDGSTLSCDGAAVFNDTGADVDFRVESDGNANMIFVDGGNDRVGIGTASPATALHVYSNDGIEQGLTITQNTDDANSGALIRLYNSSATAAMIRFGANHSSKANELFITNVGTTSPMTFATQDTERMRITSAGLVGIGTSDHDPIRELEVHNATGDCTFRIASDNSNNQTIMIELAAGTNGPSGGGYVQSTIYLIGNETSSSQVLNFKLIDNSSIKMFLDNAGINGTLVGSSDEALKENVEDLSDGTTVIKALRPRIFDWKTDEEYAGTGTGQAGFIAQEVESVFSEAVSGVEGRKGIKIMAILAHAVKAIQELEERIETLENA